jgi:Anti-sigma factor NepR
VHATPPNVLLSNPSEVEGPPVEDGSSTEPTLSPGVAAHLGDRLRAYYAHLMSDPIPDHLVRLLQALDGHEGADNDD